MELNFASAIVRTPASSITNGLSTVNLGKPDPKLAAEQHQEYVKALWQCQCEVNILPPTEDYPDSCFIEDPILCTPRGAVINRLGAASRRGEEQDTKLLELLTSYYKSQIKHINHPGTVEGGDIMMVDNHYYIGLSQRTNKEGAEQLRNILSSWGYNSTLIELKKLFHLKSGISYLQNNTILATGEMLEHPAFANYNKLPVCSEEEYATNSIWVNDHILIPKGYPKTKQLLLGAGYQQIIEVDTSEIKRVDGGLSCCSLRLPQYN